MGCQQSTPIAGKEEQSTSQKPKKPTTKKQGSSKRYDVGSNLIVFHKKDFREDYDIVKRIGEGSVSNIFLVKVKNRGGKNAPSGMKMGKIYALKEIDTEFLNAELMKEMKNEITLMSNITHPNILKFYQVYQDKNNHISIVMELCSGGDLNKRVPYTEEQAKKIIAKLLEATNYLHSHNIIHRDIKFENIMFDSKKKDAEINLIDFGLSTKFSSGSHLMDKVGTVYTMSPQVLRGDYDSQADMWSIGVVAYQLLSNEKPFWDESEKPKAIAQAVVKGEYDFNAPVWKKISPQAKDFIRKLLVIDPKVRWTAQKSLSHPWVRELTREKLSQSDSSKVYKSLNSYRQNSEFKKLALQAMAHRTTTDEIMQMKKVFHAIDVDHDGQITVQELRKALKSEDFSNDEEITKIFADIDADESGTIDYNEFLAATLEAQGEIRDDQLREAFEVFDRDQSGLISPDELRELLGVEADKKFIDRLVSEVDTNNDGQISFEEFQAAIRKTHDDVANEVLNSNAAASQEVEVTA